MTGPTKALDFGVGGAQAAILGAITGVGGGTLRDALTGRVPLVLRSELYAIPALAARCCASQSGCWASATGSTLPAHREPSPTEPIPTEPATTDQLAAADPRDCRTAGPADWRGA